MRNAVSLYGLLSTGSSLGGVIFPIMLNRLIRSVGYGWAMRASAFLILGLLILAIVTVKSRHPPAKNVITAKQMTRPFKEPGFAMMLAGMVRPSAISFLVSIYRGVSGTDTACFWRFTSSW